MVQSLLKWVWYSSEVKQSYLQTIQLLGYIHKRPETNVHLYTNGSIIYNNQKKNEWLHAITLYWVKEVSHKRLHIVWLNFYEVSKIGKSIHRKWISGCQRVGRGSNEEWLLKSTGFFLGIEKNVLKLNSGMVIQPWEHTINQWIVYLKKKSTRYLQSLWKMINSSLEFHVWT